MQESGDEFPKGSIAEAKPSQAVALKKVLRVSEENQKLQSPSNVNQMRLAPISGGESRPLEYA